MLDKWLSEFRALLQVVTDSSPSIAPINNAPGSVASSATESEIPSNIPTDGSTEQLERQTQASEVVPMSSDILQAKTQRVLAEAIELHARSVRHDSGILTNYVVIAETVDANLDNETDKRSLQLLTSPDCTPWALVGFSAALSQAVYSGSL